jgi:hypothetical protein
VVAPVPAPLPQDISKEGGYINTTAGSTMSPQSTATTVTASVPNESNSGLINIPTIIILPPLPPHWARMEQLDIVPIEFQTFLIDLGIFTTSVFLSSDVGDVGYLP